LTMTLSQTPALSQPPGLSPEAKSRLAAVVRSLRERLLKDMGDAVQSAYRLALPLEEAGLGEKIERRRRRLEARLDEEARGGARGAKETPVQARERHLLGAIKSAAATMLNRLVVLRQAEALNMVRVKVLTGGWESPGYREFRAFAPALLVDDTEGYAELLRLVFEEWALDLPGLFGEVGLSGLVPVPAATLRAAVEALEDPALAEAWTDDTTLGWVYQFWNDPDREALDEKIRNRGKIENHEIAAKTQLFTDRYMVEWLLQNSLGQVWFGICARNDWTPEVVNDGTLERLEARRAEWRDRRDRGEVDLEALMPLPGAERPDLYDLEEEERWKYWVPRELPAPASPGASTDGGVGDHAPASVREVKLLDPACGSGHFLVIAFELLAALYQEEARQRRAAGQSLAEEEWTPHAIAASILERNLHGIDLDPRAVQIAAAALWLKARTWCREGQPSKAKVPALHPRRINLVASNLGLASLPKDDPALVELVEAVERETGIPERLTRQVVEALKGADYLGSLLKVDAAVEAALATWETQQRRGDQIRGQGRLFETPQQLSFDDQDRAARRQSLVDRLEEFLKRHTRADELGLRLRGEQLAAGVRFARMLREGQYHLVVGNPPYQGTAKMEGGEYLARHYTEGKADLYAAFMLRGLQLLGQDGIAALLTMRGWMFIGSYESLRRKLCEHAAFQVVADLGVGAFQEISGHVVSAVLPIIRSGITQIVDSPVIGIARSPELESSKQKRAALLAGVGRHTFHPARLKVVPGWPLVYWWDEEFLQRYAAAEKMGEVSPARQGMPTADNNRYLRNHWEILRQSLILCPVSTSFIDKHPVQWAPYIKGAEGRKWYEPTCDILNWTHSGIELKVMNETRYRSYTKNIKNESYYFRPGIAFATIGNNFTARLHRFCSIIGDMGASIYIDDKTSTVCLLNSSQTQETVNSLNPGVHFGVGDVNRLPLFPIESADEIVARLDEAFSEHEAHRETSVEFKQPGPSCWAWAQDWAQAAVDRPAGAPLPPWEPVHTQATPLDHLSFALGVALGRFGAPPAALAEGQRSTYVLAEGQRSTYVLAEGLLDEAPASALPHGILFIAATAFGASSGDGLAHPACAPLHDAWAAHGARIAPKATLHEYLRLKFFADDHLKRYEKRPIYFPLSSEKKSFVAWVSIHRWRDDTLQVLLADHLQPALSHLSGELADLSEARQGGDRQDQARAEARAAEVQALHEELRAFVHLVEEVAEKGAPRTGKAPAREVDARFRMDLDDGVMINSAALWPLLKPQWKDPEKWWAELCEGGLPPSGGAGGGGLPPSGGAGGGKKNYDWSHLSARYFPKRVDSKCQQDPSLAVAHGVFWKYHPAKAFQWELRLQAPDELGSDFRLDEPGSDLYREDFQRQHPDQVRELREAEERRRQRKAERAGEDSGSAEGELDFEGDEEE